MRGVRTGSASGKRSPLERRVRMPLRRLGCRRRSARGGFGRLAGCRQSRWLRCRSGICRLPGGKRSRSCTPSGSGCARSLAGSVGRRRRSRASCAATPRGVAMRSCTGQRRRSGTRSDARAARRSRSSPRTTRCASTCRSASPARSPGPRGSWCRALMCAGSVVGMGAVRTGAATLAGDRMTGGAAVHPIDLFAQGDVSPCRLAGRFRRRLMTRRFAVLPSITRRSMPTGALVMVNCPCASVSVARAVPATHTHAPSIGMSVLSRSRSRSHTPTNWASCRGQLAPGRQQALRKAPADTLDTHPAYPLIGQDCTPTRCTGHDAGRRAVCGRSAYPPFLLRPASAV